MVDRIEGSLSRKWDRTMTWLIVHVQPMTKMRQDYNMTNHTSEIYAKNGIELSWSIGQSMVYNKIGTELSWPIEQDVVYHKKMTGQQCDWSYRCDLCKIQYKTVKTNRLMCSLWWRWDRITTWLLIHVRFTLKMKLNCHDQSDKI